MLEKVKPIDGLDVVNDYIQNNNIKLLSLNIFDTLVYQTGSEHSHAYAMLAKRFYPNDRSKALAFYRARISAEHTARSTMMNGAQPAEISLDEIYESFAENFCDYSDPVQKKLVELEMMCDIIRPNYEILYLLQCAINHGVEIALVSDTCYNTKQIKMFLERHIDVSKIKYFFLSCEQHTSKYNMLFQRLLTKTGYTGDQVVHLGSSRIADGNCSQFGIQFFYQPVLRHELSHACDTEIPLSSDYCYELHSHGDYYIHAMRSTMCRTPLIRDDYMLWGSIFLGPVLDGWASWAIDGFKRKNVKNIAFVGRAGHTLHECFTVKNQHLSLNEDFITEDVSISKFTAMQASLFNADFTEIFDFLMRPTPLHASVLLSQVGLELSDINYTDDPLLNSDTIVQLVNSITTNASLRERVVEFSKQCRARLLTHLARSFDGKIPNLLGLVDVGYNGTMQMRLASIFEHEGIKCQTVGYYLALTESIGDIQRPHQAYGFLVQNGQPSTFESNFMRSPGLIEQCLMPGKLGSVIGYDDNGDPQRAPKLIGEKQQENARNVQRGVFYYIANSPTIRLDNYEVYMEYCRKIISRIIIQPSEDEMNLFFRWRHETNYGCETSYLLTDYDGPPDVVTHFNPGQLSMLQEHNVPWLCGWLKFIGHKALPLVQIMLTSEATIDYYSLTRELPIKVVSADDNYEDITNLSLGNQGCYKVHVYGSQGSVYVDFGRAVTIDSVLLCTRWDWKPFDAWAGGEDHVVLDTRDIPLHCTVHINFTLATV